MRLLMATAFAALALCAQPQQRCDSSDGISRYCTVLTIQDGFTVRAPSTLEAAVQLPEDTGKVLDEYLDKALRALGKPYRLALSEKDRALDDNGKLADLSGSLVQLRNFNGPINKYFEVLKTYCAGDKCVTDPAVVLSVSGLYRDFTKYQDAPLLFDTVSDTFSAETGEVSFRVPPPFKPASVKISIPAKTPDGEQGRIRKLRGWLSGLDGTLWRRNLVAERIREFYDPLGLDPDTLISMDGPEPTIRILEGYTIHGVAFPFGLPVRGQDPDWAKVEKALYSVLPDGDFRHGYLPRRAAIRDTLSATESPAIDYHDDLGIDIRRAPLASRVRLPIEQMLAQQNGFALSISTPLRSEVDGTEFSFVDLRLEDIREAPKQADAVPRAPAVPDSAGRIDPHTAETDPIPAFATRTPIRASRRGAACEDRQPRYCYADKAVAPPNHYAGVAFQYLPGQGIRWYGLGQQERLDLPFADGSVSVRAGQGGWGTPLASGTLALDYVGFEQIHRRLALQFTGGTDSTAQRFVGGRNVDEQRNGGLVRAELEWFRDRGGHLLKFFCEGHRESVSLTRDKLNFGGANLTTMDLGTVWLYSSTGSPYPLMVRFEPVFRVAPRFANAAGYNRWVLPGRLHRSLPRRFGLDVGARFEAAAAGTPVFELPSLGGADNVRGFRRDDALARKLWSVQPELWTPLPTGNRNEFIRNNLRLAAFYDVGGVYGGPAAAHPGIRSGPGAGLRMVYGPIVMRADTAYGIGDAVTGGRRLKFYFSVVTNLPF